MSPPEARPLPAARGGEPVRDTLLPYGRQSISEADVQAVVEVLRGDWLTTGPAVEAFEQAVADHVGVRHGVAVCNGTAALHAAMHALGVGPGDEVVVPTMTFAATANAVLYVGGRPVFADCDPKTLLVDPEAVRQAITPRTKALVGVDFAGQPCDWKALGAVAEEAGIATVADGCHALGAADAHGPVGSLADLTCFSFHPVKHITTGEGGLITTDDPGLDARLRRFRNHGLTSDHRQRTETGAFLYDMVELGHNLRITDLQCALGRSQLGRLDAWVDRRRELAAAYDRALEGLPGVRPLAVRPGVRHAYHLYIVAIDAARYGCTRDELVPFLRAENIGANVHYKPVHLHSYYQEHLGTGPGQHLHAEAVFQQILSLPMFPEMHDGDVDDVVRALKKIHQAEGP